jgi:acyl-coenzyme A synthetase/AMP-(fatty) acid ligase
VRNPSQDRLQIVTGAQLQEHCRSAGLTPFKLPRHLVTLPELPRNSSGKVIKLQLRKLLVGAQPQSSL